MVRLRRMSPRTRRPSIAAKIRDGSYSAKPAVRLRSLTQEYRRLLVRNARSVFEKTPKNSKIGWRLEKELDVPTS